MEGGQSEKVKFDPNYKKCVSCPVCSIEPTEAQGDFVVCIKCQVKIHKSCYNLDGDLLRVYEDYREKNRQFPFVTICTSCCRQFLTPSADQDIYVDDIEGDVKIVEILQKTMNLNDLKNSRLVSKTWNKNASILLSKPSRQDELTTIIIIGPNQTEMACQLLRNSENKKLFRKFTFLTSLSTAASLNQTFGNIFEIIDLTHPQEISFINNEPNNENCCKTADFSDYLLNVNLFSTFLNKISSFVIRLSIDIYTRGPELLDNVHLIEFPQLKALGFGNMQKPGAGWIKKLIENCPKLEDLQLDLSGVNCDSSFSTDEFIKDSDIVILSRKIAQDLQILDLKSTDFECLDVLTNFEMKLKSLSISPCGIQVADPVSLNFNNFTPFLSSLKDTLEILKIFFIVVDFYDSDTFDEHPDPEYLKIEIPRLDHVQYFELKFDDNDKKIYFPDDVWPVKKIKLPEIFPNLKKICITYNADWGLSFDDKFPCQSVQEIVLDKWIDGDLSKTIQLFPQVETLKLDNFSYTSQVGKKFYSEISNINGWTETLKKIDITCQPYHLENFNFNILVNLPKLEEICLCLSRSKNHPENSYFIHPDLTPLQNMPKLSKLTIKNFKISKDIIVNCYEKFEKLDFTCYL